MMYLLIYEYDDDIHIFPFVIFRHASEVVKCVIKITVSESHHFSSQ